MQGNSVGRVFLALAGLALALTTAACVKTDGHPDLMPPIGGRPLDEALSTLQAWCPNVRVTVFPRVDMAGIDRHMVYVGGNPLYRLVDQTPSPDDGTVLLEGGFQRFTPGPDPAPSESPRCPSYGLSTVLITLVTSVPNMVSIPVAQAQRDLVMRGLAWKMRDGSAAATGSVLDQDLGSGMEVRVQADPPVVVTLTRGIPVPSMLGKTRTQACDALSKSDLRCEVAADAAPDWTVTGQDPVPRTVVAAQSIVRLTLHLPSAEIVSVPRVIGLTGADACREIEQAKLVCELVGERSSRVMTQDPPAYEQVTLPNTVRVIGEVARVEVPSVIGAKRADGCKMLRLQGLLCNELGEEIEGGVVNEIIQQDPPANSLVAPGSVITVRFARLIEVVVPNVVGRSLANACHFITSNELVCEPQGDVGEDEVETQMPRAGTIVPAGTHIVLTFDQDGPWWDWPLSQWWIQLIVGGIVTIFIEEVARRAVIPRLTRRRPRAPRAAQPAAEAGPPDRAEATPRPPSPSPPPHR